MWEVWDTLFLEKRYYFLKTLQIFWKSMTHTTLVKHQSLLSMYVDYVLLFQCSLVTHFKWEHFRLLYRIFGTPILKVRIFFFLHFCFLSFLFFQQHIDFLFHTIHPTWTYQRTNTQKRQQKNQLIFLDV